jgi:phage terminase large subunit-like protein
MIEELSDLSPQELLECFSQAIERQNIQEHINFRQYHPEPKQKLFHETGLVAKERAFFGANRSGKSMATSAENSMHITGNYPVDSFDSDGNPWSWNGYVYDQPVNVWVAGVTNKETFQSLKKYYLGGPGGKIGYIHPSLIAKKDEQQQIYYIKHSSGGLSTLRFKSYEQGPDSWQAETLDIIHMDEEPPSKIYSEAITRTASTSPNHHGMILLSMTPLKGITSLMLKYMQNTICDENGEEVETRKVGPEEVVNSRTYLIVSHDDAPHMTTNEKKRLYDSYSPHEREARTKGIPSMGSGLIYPVNEASLLVNPFEIPEYWPRCFGMDFGWHNTAAVFMAHDQDNDVVYLCGEYLAGHLTPQHHAYQLIKQGADWMPGGYDHAGESAMQNGSENVVELYQQAGIRNWSPADKRSVTKGIYTVLQRMETGKLKIFNNLNKLMTEMRMYSRDDNGKVNKGNDHLMDAMRYGVVTGLPLARVKNSTLKKLQIPVHGSSSGSWMRI